MTVTTVSSFKGGTGKTTLAILLGNALAAAGRRVLVIDLDHQRNLTQYHTEDWDATRTHNIAEALHREDIRPNIVPSHIEGIDLVPASFGVLKFRSIAPRVLRGLLEDIKDRYDAVLIDSPPSLDNVVLNGWVAADRILTPARLDSYDLDGLAYFRETIRGEAPDKLDSWRIVINFYHPPRSTRSDNIAVQYENAFRESYENIAPSRIPDSAAIRNAIHGGFVLSDAKAKVKAFNAITQLAAETLEEPIPAAVGGF
jgi:chromosome partitioning protein